MFKNAPKELLSHQHHWSKQSKEMLESHCPPRKIELLTLRAKVMIPYYTEVSLVGLYSSTLSELETHLVVLLRWSECSPVRMTAESTSVDYRSFTSLKLSMGVTHRQGKV